MKIEEWRNCNLENRGARDPTRAHMGRGNWKFMKIHLYPEWKIHLYPVRVVWHLRRGWNYWKKRESRCVTFAKKTFTNSVERATNQFELCVGSQTQRSIIHFFDPWWVVGGGWVWARDTYPTPRPDTWIPPSWPPQTRRRTTTLTPQTGGGVI